jgi:hypothetical protein
MSTDRRHDESPAEFAERQERAQAAASAWFNDLAAAQIALFNERMAVAAAYKGAPKWDRVRDAAKREFERTTAAASHVAALVMADMMTAGESAKPLPTPSMRRRFPR